LHFALEPKPQETCLFQFYLEEAYAERAKEGNRLEVKWTNIDPLQKGYSTLKMDEVIHADGSVTPAFEEENHFPGRRFFEVSLPLTDDAPNSEKEPSASGSSPTETETAEEAAAQARQQVFEQPDSPTSFNLRWLVLLLIPVLLLLRRMFRNRKAS